MVAITHADCFLQWANSKITFSMLLCCKKISEIWVMDPEKGMDYGVIEFYGFQLRTKVVDTQNLWVRAGYGL
jgi:hypothetical protein